MLRDPMRGSVARNRCRSGEQESDDQADPERPREGEDELTDDGNRTGGECADDETADHASASVMCPHADRNANEQRQCVDGEREQKPAKNANDTDEKEDVEKDHGESLRAKAMNGAPSTTTLALLVHSGKREELAAQISALP